LGTLHAWPIRRNDSLESTLRIFPDDDAKKHFQILFSIFRCFSP